MFPQISLLFFFLIYWSIVDLQCCVGFRHTAKWVSYTHTHTHTHTHMEKEMATHSSILAWRIPWTEGLGRLQSMGSQEPDMTEWLNNNKYIYIYIYLQSFLDSFPIQFTMELWIEFPGPHRRCLFECVLLSLHTSILVPSLGRKMVGVEKLQPQWSDYSCMLILFLFKMYWSEENDSNAVNQKRRLLAWT